jgi:post-segregation antitoxin (ccd killing protein)
MGLDSNYKKVNRITIGFNKIQFESLQKLKEYDVNLSQFIRLAIKEKIKKDWPKIKEKKEKEKTPF